MNIKIKSIQIYEDYEEKSEELYNDSKVNFIDKLLIINYNDNEIICNIEKNAIEIKRAENNIFIELNKANESTYETPYGNINMKTIGEKISINKSPFNMLFEYKIMFGSMAEYKNIIEIIEI